MSVLIESEVIHAIESRILDKRQGVQTSAFPDKARDELVALEAASQAIFRFSDQAGITKITKLFDGGCRLALLGDTKQGPVVIKISGGPTIGGRDSLKGEGPTYEAMREANPNASITPCLEWGGDENADYIVTRFRFSERVADQTDVEGLVKTDFPRTLSLIQGLKNVPYVEIPIARHKDFKGFAGHIAASVTDTDPLLAKSTYLREEIRSAVSGFNSALKHLKRRAIFTGLADCKATNIFDEQPYEYFDPAGCLCPPGWDAAQLIAESSVTDPQQLATLVDVGQAATGAGAVDIWRGIGVLQYIYAGYGIGNAQTEINNGSDPQLIGHPTVEERLIVAQQAFSNVKELSTDHSDFQIGLDLRDS